MLSLPSALRAPAVIAMLLSFGVSSAAAPPEGVQNPFPELWAGSRPALIRQRLKVSEALINKLAAEEPKPPVLAGLRARARSIRRRLKGALPSGAKGRPELHVVSCYEPAKKRPLAGKLGGVVRVTVSRKGALLDLYLSSYRAVHWLIEPAEGVSIRRVFIAGYESPRTFEGVDEARVSGGITRARFEAGERQDAGSPQPRLDAKAPAKVLLSKLEALTELAPRTMQHTYRMESAVIGPESEAWRLQLIHADVEALFAELIRGRLAKESAKLRSLAKSWAAKFPDDPLGSASRAPGLARVFPPRTPDQAEERGAPMKGFPRSLTLGDELSSDPRSRRAFLLLPPEVLVYDFAAETITELIDFETAKRSSLPRLRAMTIDPRRRRLVFATYQYPESVDDVIVPSHGPAHTAEWLWSYDLDSGRWSRLQSSGQGLSLESPGTLALAYDKARDQLYAFGEDRRGGLTITPMDSEGRRRRPFLIEESLEARDERFAGLLPRELSRDILAGALLRVHDGKALLCLRLKLPQGSALRATYAIDLDGESVVAAGIEAER